MKILRVSAMFSAALGLAVLAQTPGQAADLGYGSIKDVPPPPSHGRTWYLKGTIGMSNPVPDGMDNEVYDNGFFTIGHTDIKSAPLFGMGIGVEHNRWLRFDLTGEYRGKQIFVGQDSYSNAGGGANEFLADLETWVGLANAYIDLGTFRGVTPYVGGGVGFASISVLGLADVNPTAGALYRGADNTQTNFAWALYAGLAYDVTPQFTMDFGYRYLDMGSARSGVVSDVLGINPSYSYHEIEDITSHDLLVSGRWRLNNPAPVYALK